MWLRGASLQHDKGAGRTSSLQRGATGGGWGDGSRSRDRLPNLAGELQGPALLDASPAEVAQPGMVAFGDR